MHDAKSNLSDYPEKGEILVVGGFDRDGNPVGWAFGPSRVGLQISADGARWSGWTLKELQEKAGQS